MIRLDSVSKQHGHQILFLDSSMSVFKGEKDGLVGPNGSGKSTIFRLIGISWTRTRLPRHSA